MRVGVLGVGASGVDGAVDAVAVGASARGVVVAVPCAADVDGSGAVVAVGVDIVFDHLLMLTLSRLPAPVSP